MSSSMVTAFHAHPEEAGGTEEKQRTSDPTAPDISADTVGHGGHYLWKCRQDAVGRGRDGVIQHFSIFETMTGSPSPTYKRKAGASGPKKRPAPSGGCQIGQESFESPDRGASRARITSETEVLAPGESACGVSFDTWYAERLTGEEELTFVD